MPGNPGGPRLPIVVATTLPFFAGATTIVEETWRELDRIAGALDVCAAELSPDITERAGFNLLTSGMRELGRRTEQHAARLGAFFRTSYSLTSLLSMRTP